MKKSSKKDKIICDVIPVFVELGYSNATMRLIASRLNMNLSLITYYFESKEKLYHSCIQKSMGVLLEFVGERLLESSKNVKSKNEAIEVISTTIVDYTLKALCNKDFRDYSKLLDRTLVEYDDIVNNIDKNYLQPLYSSFCFLLNYISKKKKSDRELFLQIYSIVGLSTIFVRDYAFVFKKNLNGAISDSDRQIVEKIIKSHLLIILTTISLDI
ncbi:MAG: hypothetical protein COB02_05400 [Candidatus Cloacimonadota bacterium]|nr:MAG: hypothetical protein COB02_05400 [Candidatus Cloacimonadota bacterium]